MKLGFARELGIDLGTSTILVYRRDRGIVLTEPTVVAVKNGKVLAVRNEAREMLGRTPGNIRAIRPLKNGVIADYTTTRKMFAYLFDKILGKRRLFKPRVMVCVPSGVTNVERRAVIKAAQEAGAGAAITIEEPKAAAIGCGLPIDSPGGNMVVDMGGGTVDIAVISLGGPVVSESLRVAGNAMDDAIIRYVRSSYNLLIGEPTAEDIKIKIGSAFTLEQELEHQVRGRDSVTGLPKTVTITSEEIREAMSEPVKQIAERICDVLEKTPPELSSDIIERGITLTGGGAMLRGFDTLLEEITMIPVRVAENALNCVAIGTGRALENYDAIIESGTATKL